MFSYKKVGGLHWFYVGRLCFSMCVRREAARRKFVRQELPRLRSVVIEGRRVFAAQ